MLTYLGCWSAAMRRISSTPQPTGYLTTHFLQLFSQQSAGRVWMIRRLLLRVESELGYFPDANALIDRAQSSDQVLTSPATTRLSCKTPPSSHLCCLALAAQLFPSPSLNLIERVRVRLNSAQASSVQTHGGLSLCLISCIKLWSCPARVPAYLS